MATSFICFLLGSTRMHRIHYPRTPGRIAFVPRLERDDGVEIHWEERGEGPLVVLAPYSIFHPSVYDSVATDLATDHRVLRYDDRGTGESSRQGPYDMQTGAADLAAVIEAAGEPAVIVGLGDASNRAVRAYAERPDLIEAMVVPGGMPAGRGALAGSEAMASSDTVVNAFLSMYETDYRGALRSLITSGNPQMTEAEIRERVRQQADYQPQETALARLRAWVNDDALEPARACGDRLWLLCSETMGGGWFPAGREAMKLSRELFPEAHVEEVEDGLMSRPDLTAGVVRRVRSKPRAARA
jgi:pimeloyl-ACP methyl ester carboxylesterase